MAGNHTQLKIDQFVDQTSDSNSSTTDEDGNNGSKNNIDNFRELEFENENDTVCTNCGSSISDRSIRVFYPSYVDSGSEVDVCPQCPKKYKKANAAWISESHRM
jgi:hypothetical protein